MITLTKDEIRELISLSRHGMRLYLHLRSDYQGAKTNYDVSEICKALEFSKRTLYRCIKELYPYLECNTVKNTITITFYRFCDKSVTVSDRIGTRERDLNSISADGSDELQNVSITSCNSIHTLSCAKSVTASDKSVTGNRNEYELDENFYSALEDLGIRVDDELKGLLKFVGAYEVTAIYNRIMWDSTIRKPATIFLKELDKACKAKRDQIDDRPIPEVFSVSETRSESLEWIFNSYPHSFEEAATYYGYTLPEIEKFLSERNPEN